MKNYIFGYGSLIEYESRLRTTPKAKYAFPVKVNGFKRGWFARTGGNGFSTTFLGCIKDDKSQTNGVIYEVSEDDLNLIDKREIGYKRVKIDAINIINYCLKIEIEKISNIWIYINEFENNQINEANLPSKIFPIVQSYVDICLNGCLEVEKLFPNINNNQFVIDFIHLTQYWSSYWVNDRIYPRRPFIYCPNAFKIDRLLEENLEDKNIFNNIYIE